MKRSEMLKQLARTLNGDKMNYYLIQDMNRAKEVLDVIEKAGMMPPGNISFRNESNEEIKVFSIENPKWEPEDGN